MKAKYIYEKFTEDSDPIQNLGIGLRYFLEQQYKIEANTTPEQGSLKFFKSKNYRVESLGIYYFLKFLLENKHITQQNINVAFKQMLDHTFQGEKLGYLINISKVREALKNFYGIEIENVY